MSKKLDIIKQNLSEHEALIEKVLSEDGLVLPKWRMQW